VDPSRFQGPADPHPGGWRVFPEEWPEHSLLSREVLDVVRRAVATLPERQRIVVSLRDLDGQSAEEVAALLGISPGNQRVLLHRGRSTVRAHVERYLTDSSELEVAR
jgi:RNA polymerase sigma-70 factor (ECF subfamily)